MVFVRIPGKSFSGKINIAATGNIAKGISQSQCEASMLVLLDSGSHCTLCAWSLTDPAGFMSPLSDWSFRGEYPIFRT